MRATIDRSAAWLSLVVGLLITFVTMHLYGVGWAGCLLLALVSAVTIVLPGFALTGWARRESLFTRLGLSFAVGLPVQLLGWVLGVSVDSTVVMWLLPILVTVGGVALRRARRAPLLASRRHRLRWWESLVLIALWLYWLVRLASGWIGRPPGAGATAWYQDMYWHLGISADARYRVPISDPQALGESLNYHWLANVHAGALARATGLDVEMMVAVGWTVLPQVALLAVSYGFARYLSRSRLAGLVAAVLVVFPPRFGLDPGVDLGVSANFFLSSPSHMLSLPIVVSLAWMITAIYRGTPLHEIVPGLVGLLLIASGVKISTLPGFIAGLGLVLIWAVLRKRRRLVTCALLAGTTLALAVSLPLFGGGGGGSKLVFLGGLQDRSLYQATLKWNATQGHTTSYWLLAAFLFVCVANLLPAAAGLVAFRFRDPVALFLTGLVASATGVVLVLRHPSQSQLYFALGVQPILAILTAVGLAHAIRRTRVRRSVAAAALAVTMIAAACLGVRELGSSHVRLFTAEVARVHVFWTALVSLLIAGALVLRRRVVQAMVFSAVTAYSIGAMLAPALDAATYHVLSPGRVHEAISSAERGESRTARVTPDDIAGLTWIDTNAPRDPILATNVHCTGPVTRDHCDARGFWPAGLGERRVLVGAWAYTEAARAAQGRNGYSYTQQPFDNVERYRLNQALFAAPTPEVLRQARVLGVGYLFADTRASAVSPRLAELAEVVFRRGTVTVYRLR